MSKLSKYPKYTKADIFCTETVNFSEVDIGNLFMIYEDIYMRMNYPGKRLYARNTVCICSPDPGMCGIGLYLDAHDEVDVITETSINFRGPMKIS